MIYQDDPLDNEGYPTDEFIEWIEKVEDVDVNEFVELIKTVWHFGDWGFRIEDGEDRMGNPVKKLLLSTGGWSGNEAIVNAITSNFHLIFRKLKYEQWNSGGHYVFHIKQDNNE